MASSAPLPPLENVFIAIHLVLARRLMVTHFDMDLNPTVAIKDLKEELVAQVNERKRQKPQQQCRNKF